MTTGKLSRHLLCGLCGLSGACGVVALAAAPLAADTVWLVSQGGLDDVTAAAGSVTAMSADGRYLLVNSTASGWLPGHVDTNGELDVFLWDRDTWAATLVSHAAASPKTAGNGDSLALGLTPDGRYVLFSSSATDLLAGIPDTNTRRDLFRWDRLTGETVLVTRGASAPTTTANGDSSVGILSPDGRWVTFGSGATDLVAGMTDTSNTTDLFQWDATTGTTTLITHTAASTATAAGGISASHQSTDGRYVFLRSTSANLVAGVTDTNNAPDAFLWDRTANAMTLISHIASSTTTAGPASSSPIGLSSDGRWAVYTSTASNLVSGVTDTNNTQDAFQWDRTTNTSRLISHAAASTTTAGNAGASGVSTSDDGRWILLQSDATDLVTGQVDANGSSDAFLWDRDSGVNTLVSHAHGAPTTTGVDFTSAVRISRDGRFALLDSPAADLVAPGLDGNSTYDALVWDRTTGLTTPVSLRVDNAGTGNADSTPLYISDDGRYVSFSSRADDLVAATVDSNDQHDAFLRDRNLAVNLLVQRATSIQSSSNNDVYPVKVNASGQFVAYLGYASDLDATVVDENQAGDAFLWDRATGTSRLVSRNPTTGAAADGESEAATLSSNGRYLGFVSTAPDLIAGGADSNGGKDAFLWDRTTGSTTLISRSAASPTAAGNGASGIGAMTPDGLWVALFSDAVNLMSGLTDTNNDEDAYLWNRDTGAMSFISHSGTAATTAANDSTVPTAISVGGRYVALRSAATNLIAGGVDANGSNDAFLWDRDTNLVSLISHSSAAANTAANELSEPIAVSGQGRWVVFWSEASDLVAGGVDTNGARDTFFWDRDTGIVTLVSHAQSSTTTAAAGSSTPFGISLDGRYVTFESDAADLLAPGADNNGARDVFQWDRVSGAITLASHAVGSTAPGNAESFAPAASDDGSVVAFASDATNLIAGQVDRPGIPDVFVWSRSTGEVRLVSRVWNAPAQAVADFSMPTDVSADGEYVLFHSGASNLMPGDFGPMEQAFLWSAASGRYNTVSPCRVIDTRSPTQGPALAPGVGRIARVAGVCGIPFSAKAVTVNVTATNGASAGAVEAWAGYQDAPGTAIVAYAAGQTRANNAVLALALDGSGTVTLRAAAAATVDVILDVSGYFE